MKKLIIFVSKFQKLKTIDNGIVSKKRILPKSGLIPNEIENIQSKSYKTSCGQLPITFSPKFLLCCVRASRVEDLSRVLKERILF